MSDVVKFLLARLDEDEETALVAEARHVYWHARDGAVANHIARHNPTRVLAEVAAKRAIVEHHDRLLEGAEVAAYAGHPDYRQEWARAAVILHAIRYLAVAYADHPDYRREWAP